MLKSTITRIVDFCTRHAWLVMLAAGLLTVGSAAYTAVNFAINTDISKLISPDLPWRQREIALAQAFPQRDELVLVVIQAPTPELAAQAADKLTQKLAPQTSLFRSVHQAGGGAFFERNGLLFLPTDEVKRTTGQLATAEPLLAKLAADPSLRGSLDGLSLSLTGVQLGHLTLDDMARPLTQIGDTLDDVLANRPASFSWQVLMSGKPPQPSELRQFIEVRPVLDYNALEPPSARRRWTSSFRPITAPPSGSPDRCRSPTRNSPPSRKARSSTPSARSSWC